MQVAPTVTVEGRAVRRRGAVEGQLLSCGKLRGFELLLVATRCGDGECGRNDLDVFSLATALGEPRFQGRHRVFEQRFAAVERVRDETVSGFACNLRHERPETAGDDWRWTVRVRTGIERRDHDRVPVELTAEVEFRFAFPGVEDRANREHDFAHPRRGLRPRHAETLFDMGLDLRAEAKNKAPPANALHPVGEVREVHRVSRKRNGDRGPQSQSRRVFRRKDEGQKGVVLGLKAECAVVADLFETGVGGARIARVFERGSRINLHRGILIVLLGMAKICGEWLARGVWTAARNSKNLVTIRTRERAVPLTDGTHQTRTRQESRSEFQCTNRSFSPIN